MISIETAAVVVPHAGGERDGEERHYLPSSDVISALECIILACPSEVATSDGTGTSGEQEANYVDPS